jgi:hypothetical protein
MYSVIINDFGDTVRFTNMKQREISKESLYAFAGHIDCNSYLPRVALRSLSKGNGVSPSIGAMLLVVTPATNRLIPWPLDHLTLLLATSTYGNVWKTKYTNLRCHSYLRERI